MLNCMNRSFCWQGAQDAKTMSLKAQDPNDREGWFRDLSKVMRSLESTRSQIALTHDYCRQSTTCEKSRSSKKWHSGKRGSFSRR